MKRLAALFSGVAVVVSGLAWCGDVPVQPFSFSTTSASGTLGPTNPAGATGCTITIKSGGGATLTVLGAADATVGGTYVTNTNFGTSGMIATPANGTVYNGNVSAYPVGFEVTFTGNTGTLSGAWTCSGASGSTSGGGSITAVVSPIPLPVIPTGVPTWPVDNNGIPIVTTPPPYVAPTCNPGNNNAACVQQLSVDPCADSTLVQRFVQATPASATGPIAMVTPSTGQFIHICSLRISVYPSAAPGQVVTLTQGTSTNCGTSNTVVAAYELQSGLIMPNDRELFPGVPIVSSGFCYTTTTASPTSIGITFIQQ